MSLLAAKGINVDAAEEAEQQGTAPKPFFGGHAFMFLSALRKFSYTLWRIATSHEGVICHSSHQHEVWSCSELAKVEKMQLFHLKVIDRRFVQSAFQLFLPFPSAFHGLFTRWMLYI